MGFILHSGQGMAWTFYSRNDTLFMDLWAKLSDESHVIGSCLAPWICG